MEGRRKYENEWVFSCHFFKPLLFVWGLPKWKFLQQEIRISSRENNLEKCLCSPPEKYSSYARGGGGCSLSLQCIHTYVQLQKGNLLKMNKNCNQELQSTCFQEKLSFFTSNSIQLRGYFQTKFCSGGNIWCHNIYTVLNSCL